MISGDYFFLIFLGIIAGTRLLLIKKFPPSSIGGIRLRHYMYGIVLIIIAFLIKNLTIYAIGFGLLIDEIPVMLVKGPGHKDEYWRGCEDYHTRWSFADVLVLMFITYLLRNTIAGLI